MTPEEYARKKKANPSLPDYRDPTLMNSTPGQRAAWSQPERARYDAARYEASLQPGAVKGAARLRQQARMQQAQAPYYLAKPGRAFPGDGTARASRWLGDRRPWQ